MCLCVSLCCAASGLDGGHLALNFWFHPPTNLDPSAAGFKAPYACPFFPSLWAARQPWLQQDTHAWWQQQQRRQQQLLQASGQPQQQQQAGAQQQAGSRRRAQQRARGITWARGVPDVGNAYSVCNTRPGTATGSPSVLPQQAANKPTSIDSSDDDSEEDGTTAAAAASATPDDEQQHRQLGREVAEGIDALEAYFSDNPDAMRAMLSQFLASRRARLAASGPRGAAAAGGLTTLRLPRLRGRRHHYAVVSRTVPRKPRRKPPGP